MFSMALSALWYAASSLLFGLCCGIGLVMEAAVGERTAEALVEEQEQQRDVHAFGRQPVSVAATIAFQQTVPFEFAEIVAELVQPVGFAESWNVVRTAWWICLAVQPPTVLPPCRRTSIRRMIRVSWILMPG